MKSDLNPNHSRIRKYASEITDDASAFIVLSLSTAHEQDRQRTRDEAVATGRTNRADLQWNRVSNLELSGSEAKRLPLSHCGHFVCDIGKSEGFNITQHKVNYSSTFDTCRIWMLSSIEDRFFPKNFTRE
ncbi:hypothetical protein AVEN_233639-1 [Araneus ventricosus]|uniref:Uncharacterized protein n=1 Tax=Araneus ventricosus TaxID=182803 RepID=A0A4Y2KQM0_ARAVE|nr:hypothetical protein AVEN_233639-1 [Araneus ventricosus]